MRKTIFAIIVAISATSCVKQVKLQIKGESSENLSFREKGLSFLFTGKANSGLKAYEATSAKTGKVVVLIDQETMKGKEFPCEMKTYPGYIR